MTCWRLTGIPSDKDFVVDLEITAIADNKSLNPTVALLGHSGLALCYT
jgi:hypothetical protein